MLARNTTLLTLILFAALAPADFKRVAHATPGSNDVPGPAPATHCAQAALPGTRCTRLSEEQLPAKCSKNNNAPAAVSFKASKSVVYSPADCPAGGACAEGGMAVELAAEVKDPDGDEVAYSYSATGGRIKGEGANVTWDLTGLAPGTYTANVEFDDRCGCVGFTSVTVTVDRCSCESAPSAQRR